MNAKAVAGATIAVAFVALVAVAILPTTLPWPAIAPAGPGVGTALWTSRTVEVLLQAFVLLGGVVAILLLLGVRAEKEASP